MTVRKITGYHVAAGFGAGFAVIIAVNLTLAFQAVATFPGLEVQNSYVASQSFDRRRAAQRALGWDVQASLSGDGVTLSIRDRDGRAVRPVRLDATLGRATRISEDVPLALRAEGPHYSADVRVAPGAWMLRLRGAAPDGTSFQYSLPLFHES